MKIKLIYKGITPIMFRAPYVNKPNLQNGEQIETTLECYEKELKTQVIPGTDLPRWEVVPEKTKKIEKAV